MSANYNDWLVSGLAFVIAFAAAVVSVGSWESPYRLRSVRVIVERFGKSAGRAFWVVVAIVSMVSGVMIATGIRPGYAQPSGDEIEVAR
ncbi:MAG: hypothetical protein AAGJ83_08330 [Planctomycetota bacterium]